MALTHKTRVHPRWTDGVRINIVADTHLYAAMDGDPTNPGPPNQPDHYYYAGSERLRLFVEATNQDGADLALHAGDMIDRPSGAGGDATTDFAIFNAEWSALTMPTAVVPGNHDMKTAGLHDAVAVHLGYSANPLIAQSRFNQSLRVENDYGAVRVIMVDTNIHETGHEDNVVGRALPDLRSWLASELAAATEPAALIVSHHGPHARSANRYGTPSTFNEVEAEAYRVLAQAAVDARQPPRVYTVFGHVHPAAPRWPYANMGADVPGVAVAAMVMRSVGMFLRIAVLPAGRVLMKPGRVDYA